MLAHITNLSIKFSDAILKPAVILSSTAGTSLIGVIMLMTNVAQDNPWTTIGIVITPMATVIIALIALTYKNLVKVVNKLDAKLDKESDDREKEVQKLRDDAKHTEERLIDKMEQIIIYRHNESKQVGESLEQIQEWLAQAKIMNLTLQEITKTKTKNHGKKNNISGK